jgi:cephalosporin hydroxylase
MNKEQFDSLFYKHPLGGPSQHPDELWNLIKWLETNYPVIETIIEIGVFKGGTTRFWNALISSTGLYVGIDLNDRGLVPSVQEKYSLDDRMKFIIGDSTDKQVLLSCSDELDGRKADILFIDGNHRPEYFTADYRNYEAMVKAGGLIIFHDLADVNIGRFYNELKLSTEYDNVEFWGQKEPCGIGVLIKK